MEEGRTKGAALYDSDRIKNVLEKIVGEGRIAVTFDGFEKMLN